MAHLFNDEDDFLHSSPKEKFYDIVFNANNDIVRQELDKLIEEFVIQQVLLEQIYGDEELEQKKFNFKMNHLDEVANGVNDIFVEKMSDILSQSE